MSKSREYVGQFIKISFDTGRCIHAAECVRGLPDVFNPDRKPWVEPDAASADAIAAVIRKCPTGALHYESADSDQVEQAPDTNLVRIARDGPLYVHAKARVADSAGALVISDTRVALCRCGESENKPFCDGRHKDAGFKDPGMISSELDESGAAPTGELEIRAIANGPLVCKGRVELINGANETIGVSENAALCRCGQSKNKPFCDGTHSQVGFETES